MAVDRDREQRAQVDQLVFFVQLEQIDLRS
jgi:hypothetical protein